MARVAELDPRVDASIGNRLELWRAIARMSLDHPWRGVGFMEFRELLSDWYLPSGLGASYQTGVSNAMTVLGYGGYLELFAYAFFAVLILWASFESFRSRGGNWLGVALGLVAFHVGGLFSFLHASIWLNLLFIALSGAAFAGWMSLGEKRRWRVLGRGTAIALGMSGTLCATVLTASWFSAQRAGFRLEEGLALAEESEEQDGFPWIFAKARESDALLVFLGERRDNSALARGVFRDLLSEGISIAYFEEGNVGAPGARELEEALAAWLEKRRERFSRVVLAGRGPGARTAAWIVTNRRPVRTLVDGVALWQMDRGTVSYGMEPEALARMTEAEYGASAALEVQSEWLSEIVSALAGELGKEAFVYELER